MKSWFALCLFGQMALFAGVGWGQADPGGGPPLRPMIIHGEILVDGAVVPAATPLLVRLGTQPVTAQTVETFFGSSCYRIQLPPDSAAGQASANLAGAKVAFLRLGERPLSLPEIDWQEGGALKRDILINSPVTQAPAIKTATATRDTNTFDLRCTFAALPADNPVYQNLTYRIQWWARIEAPAANAAAAQANAPEMVFLQDETLTGVTGDKESRLTVTKEVKGLLSLEVIVTPSLSDGKRGPSSLRRVFVTETEKGL